MSRFVKLALFALLALTAFFAVVRAEEKYYDDEGKEIEFYDTKVGDEIFEEEHHEKRTLNIRGKSSFGVDKRNSKKHDKELFTHGPDEKETLWVDGIKITWYASNDLKDPACGNGKWDPTNGNHIGAVVKGWDKGPSCGDFIRLCNPKVSRCVRVRIVDQCAGCKNNHVDLTKSAFKRLATTGTLDEGVTTGLTMWTSQKPNPWDLALFGPFKLK